MAPNGFREELRRRFVKAESTLFRVRYDSDDRTERSAFLKSRKFNWIEVCSNIQTQLFLLLILTQVGEDEKKQYGKELLAACGNKSENHATETYYKVGPFQQYSTKPTILTNVQVKWTRVPDLVDKRKIFLQNGWAYVPGRDQSSIVHQEFETHLTKALEVQQTTSTYTQVLTILAR